MATAVGIPAWQLADLQALSGQGQLSGVNPDVLAAISDAESGGEVKGAAVNGSDYGGYFGLGGPSSVSPSGFSDAVLETNSQASFLAQAPVAAADFAAAQAKTGNNYSAESAYQGGGAQGSGVFAQLGLPASPGGPYPVLSSSISGTAPASAVSGPTSVNAATSSGSGATGAVTTSATSSGGGLLGSILGGVLGVGSSSFLEIGLTLVLVAGGLGLIVLGFTRLFPQSKQLIPLAAAAAA